jgi:HEAT repeat protein
VQVIALKVVEWLEDADRIRSVAYKPNGDWRTANRIELGRTVFGTGDLAPYVPLSVEEKTQYYDATKGMDGLTSALRSDSVPDWLTFTYTGDSPKLVYFQLDLPERDNIPPDVSVFVEKDGSVVPYDIGADPVTAPHEVQSLPGNKFTTRVITKGTYYVRVIANHPEWQLRTQVLDAPPYSDPQKAVRAGIDYLLGAGDSWHANIPRSGSRLNRVSSVHAETAQCIACHPTQFSTRGVFTAMKHGYRPERMESLRFLTERMANNPRPFYGHPEAAWVRMISAPGNVTSRAADLVAERNYVLNEPLDLETHLGAYNYLKLYYQGRKELPEDESNGNTPLVSQYEVVYYAWRVFDRERRRTDSAESKQLADLTAKLLDQDRHKNLIDLCWHTIAVAEVDSSRFADKIKANCDRILSLQRPDGQWSMQLDPKSAAVEFQTGHALYALAAAGFRPDHAAVKKTIDFLLARQQSFGGWFDPNQTYENFRTPFRETQFAVMALAKLYPAKEAETAGSAQLTSRTPHELLDAIDQVQGKPSPQVVKQLESLLKSPEPLVRQQSAQALGRLGNTESVRALAPLLGDPAKMVQRSAAVAIRAQTALGASREPVLSQLKNRSARVRTGALRVFAYHSRPLAQDSALGSALIGLTADSSVACRMSALQALWQHFWWTRDTALKGRIVDSALARLEVDEHPWVARSAREALYNVADENTRYLYNNWIPALANPADREKASTAQRAQDEMIARKLASALMARNPRLRLNVLQAVSEFHLRNVRAQNTRYARIGNDVEQIRFAAQAGSTLDSALAACLADPSPKVRRYAAIAAYTLRDNGPLRVATSLLGALLDPDSAVRAAAAEFYRSLPPDPTSKETEAVVTRLLAGKDSDARRAGMEIALSSEGLQKAAGISDSLDRALSAETGMTEAIDLLRKSAAARKTLRGVSIVADSLLAESSANRASALEILQKDDALRAAPAVRDALNEVIRAGGPSAESARKLVSAAELASPDSARRLDIAFFSRRVMPVFARKSASDGLACVSCHFNHNILRVTAPDSEGRFTESQVRETYRAALKVVNLRNPEESLLLRKPTSSSASEGLVDAKSVAHGGGMRWSGPEDPEYQVILSWIKGAKEGSADSRR